MIAFFKNIKENNKIFYTFLLIHLIVWTGVSLIRVVLPTDSLEGIYWGSLSDFGTNKHPPLGGWLTYLAYIPFKMDFFVYLLSQMFIIGGFIYIYKIARCFLDEKKSILSVIILEGCWCYSYITSYYGFNPDVVLLFTLPAITYYFYNCMKDNKASDWIKLGLFVGFSLLSKYQTVLVFIPMFLWVIAFKREVFKSKIFYVTAIMAFLIFLPHLLWMIKYEFFPLLYFEGELSARHWFDHITSPLNFLLMQFVAILGSLLIFIVLKFKFKSPFKFIENYNKKDFWFLILIGLIPLIIHLVMGFITGGTMRPRWGYEFWFLTGIMLFYFFPIDINKKEFLFTVKSAYVLMIIVFLVLATMYSVEKNYRSRYPVETISTDMKKIWAEKYSTPLKYVGGYIEFSMPLTVYDETHPINLMDTNKYKSPWIDEKDLEKSGAIVIERYDWGVEYYARKTIPYIPKDYEIQKLPYKFKVYNAFKMPREYTIHYAIIPPLKDLK